MTRARGTGGACHPARACRLNSRNAAKGEPELSARIGLESRAGGRRGDWRGVRRCAEYSRASSGRRRAGLSARHHECAAPGRRAFRRRGTRRACAQRRAEPVALYRIVRASGGRRFGARLDAAHWARRGTRPLARRWERAVRGEGQLALVVGEPGIGKSRLVEEFRLKLGETPHTWAEFSSSQLLQNTPLHPIAEWGRQRFGDADTPVGQRLADLENTLQLIGLDPAEHAPLVAPLVDIPLPPGRGATCRRRAQAKAARGPDRLVSGGRAHAARCARVRGPALGRPDLARSFAGSSERGRTGAAVHPRDHSAGIPPALEPALTSQRHLA